MRSGPPWHVGKKAEGLGRLARQRALVRRREYMERIYLEGGGVGGGGAGRERERVGWERFLQPVCPGVIRGGGEEWAVSG